MSYAGPASRPARRPLEIDPAAPNRGRAEPSGPKPLPRPLNHSASAARGRAAVFTAGVALGVLVGAGIALLLAPQTGADTRRALARRGRRLTGRGRDAWDDLRVELR